MSEWIWVGDDIRPMLRSRNKLVALDLETTGLDFHDDVLGMAAAWRTSTGMMRSTYLRAPVGQISLDDPIMERGSVDIQEFIETVHGKHYCIFHNEVFDARGLYRIHPKSAPTLITHDTKHLAGLVDWQEEKSLDWLYKKYVGKPQPPEYAAMKKKRGKISKLPLQEVAHYGRADGEYTLELFEQLEWRMDKIIDREYYFRDRLYAGVVMDMMRAGLKLDFEWCQLKEQAFRERMFVIEGYLREMGLKHPSSNEEVATFVFKTQHLPTDLTTRTDVKTTTWPEGVPSVAKAVLERYKEFDESIALIIEWRELSSAISKWLHDYRLHASVDGRIHSLIDPFGTVSARMAASKPNVQAIPMEDRGAAFGSMKGMLIGEGGNHKLRSVDYSQAEARLASVMAREKNMIKAFNSDIDPYVQMALSTWNDPDRRNDAKRATLAGIYGVGPDKFAETWDVPIGEAIAILKAFRRQNPRMKLAAQLAQQQADQEGRIVVYSGRPRWFGGNESTHKAFNQMVQMTVAEILKEAILGVAAALPGILRLQVHDSIVVETNKLHRGTHGVLGSIKEIMEDAVPPEYSEIVRFPTKEDMWQ